MVCTGGCCHPCVCAHHGGMCPQPWEHCTRVTGRLCLVSLGGLVPKREVGDLPLGFLVMPNAVCWGGGDEAWGGLCGWGAAESHVPSASVDSVAVEEQERERRRQVVEKFQKAPFEEIAAHCGARVSRG